MYKCVSGGKEYDQLPEPNRGSIAFARNVAGRSQQELADMLGRDKRTIQKWERGEIRIALEDFLDVIDT